MKKMFTEEQLIGVLRETRLQICILGIGGVRTSPFPTRFAVQNGMSGRRTGSIDTRAGPYGRTLETRAGAVTLKMPKLRRLLFETAIIQQYRRKESSVEEALVEMYLAGLFVRLPARLRPTKTKSKQRLRGRW